MCVKVIDLAHLTHDSHGAGTAERFNKPLASAAQDREQAGDDAHRDVRRRRSSLTLWVVEVSLSNGSLERVLWSGVLKGGEECLLPHLALDSSCT